MFFLSLVEEFRIVHPILVVVPVGLVPTWERELQLWAPKLNMVNYASKIEDARDVVRRMEFSLPNEHFKPQIVLTTFEVINCVRISKTFPTFYRHVGTNFRCLLCVFPSLLVVALLTWVDVISQKLSKSPFIKCGSFVSPVLLVSSIV